MTDPPEEADGTAPSGEAGVVREAAESLGALDPQEAVNRAKAVSAQQIPPLRKWFAKVLLWTLVIQIGIADIVFFVYGWKSGWKIPASAIGAWLGAVVVQVVALVLAITKFIFSAEALDLDIAASSVQSARKPKERPLRRRRGSVEKPP